MSLFSKRAELEAGHSAFPTAVTNHAYGIDDAVQLMRTLPMNQNTDLVLLVIRNTLASMNVDLRHVIHDGETKEGRLRETIAGIKGAMAKLERELDERRAELAAVEADLTETSLVKERLELAAAQPEPIVVPPGLSASNPSTAKTGSTPPRPPVRARPQASPADPDRATTDAEPLADSSPVREKST